MKWLKGIWIGLWSGLLLGGLLKWTETVTGKSVYTLLLNIDFLPLIGNKDWPETELFLFHLLFSIGLGIIYVFLAKRKAYTFGQLFLISLSLSLPLCLLYFPLSLLAEVKVTSASDMEAFLYWVLGHLAFSLSLPALYKGFERQNKNAASQ